MPLQEFWSSLSETEKQIFAEKSGYKAAYINIHLVYGRKVPPLKKIKKMAEASNGKLPFLQLCEFFANRPSLQNKTPNA